MASTGSIAVDIGSSTIKVAQIIRGTMPLVIRVGVVPSPAPSDVAAVLRRLIDACELTATEAVTTIASDLAIEPAPAIHLGATVVRPRGRHDIDIAEIRGTLQAAGLWPVTIDIEPFALLRALKNPRIDSSHHTVAVLNLGASLASIHLFRSNMLRHSQRLRVTGNDLAQAISHSLNLSPLEAERLMIAEGISCHASTVPVLKGLVEEIRSVITGCGGCVDRVVLAGGTACLMGLVEDIGASLDIPTQTWQPPENILITGPSAEELRKLAPMLMTVTGLAFR